MKFTYLITTHGFTPYTKNPTLTRKTTSRGIKVLAIYINYILLISSDEVGISSMEAYLHNHFVMWDL